MFKKAKPALLASLLALSLLLAACSDKSSEPEAPPPEQPTSAAADPTNEPAGGTQDTTGRPGEFGALSGTLVSVEADGSFTLTAIDAAVDVPIRPEDSAEWILEAADEEAGTLEDFPFDAADLPNHIGTLVTVQGAYEGDTFIAARVIVRQLA